MAWWGTSVLDLGQTTSGALTFSGQIPIPVGASLPTPGATGIVVVIPGTSGGGSLSFSPAVSPIITQGGDQRIVLSQVTDVPQGNQPLAPPCPLFSPHDYLELVRFKETADLAGVGGTTITINQPPGEPMPQSFGFGIPVEENDYFRFRAYGNAGVIPVSFFGRIESYDKVITPFNHTLTTDAINTVITQTPQTGVGILLGAAASVPLGSITNGVVFGIGEIGRLQGATFTPHTLLFSGQLDSNIPLSSNSPTIPTPLNRVTFDFFTDTGGATVTYAHTVTPATGTRMRFTRVGFDYTASATAGTRQPGLFFRKNGTSWQTVLWPLNPTAGQTRTFDSSISGGISTIGNYAMQPLNDSLYFYDSMDINILDLNLVSGSDVVKNVFIRWELS